MAFTPQQGFRPSRSGKKKATQSSGNYQVDLISDREELLRQIGIEPPAPKKPKVGFITKLFSVLDSAGGFVRAGIKARDEGETGVEVFRRAAEAFRDASKRPTGKELFERFAPDVDSKIGKAIGGFAVEVLTDPLSWVSFGAGGLFTKGTKIITKAGNIVTLNAAGTRLSTEIARKSAERGLGTNATRVMSNLISKNPEAFAKYVDKGGVKFAGLQTPLTAARLKRVADWAHVPAINKYLGQTTLGKMATGLSELVVPDKRLVRELTEAGAPKKKIREVLALRRNALGEKSLSLANRTDTLKRNYLELVKLAPEVGLGSGREGARRIAQALPINREMVAVKQTFSKMYGENWASKMDTILDDIYRVALQKETAKGNRGLKAIRAAKQARQRYQDAFTLDKMAEGAAVPKVLQPLYESVLKNYKDIGERDKTLGFITGLTDDYMFRDTRPIQPRPGFGQKSKYAVDKGGERVFESVAEIDLARNWEREYDFLKGVTVRGFKSDVNKANQAFMQKMATITGVPLERFTPGKKMDEFWSAMETTLGKGGLTALRQAGIRSIDDIASLTPAQISKRLAETPTEVLNLDLATQQLTRQRERLVSSLQELSTNKTGILNKSQARLVGVRQRIAGQADKLREELAITVSDVPMNIRGRSLPAPVIREKFERLSTLEKQLADIDGALMKSGQEQVVSTIRKTEKALATIDNKIRQDLITPLQKQASKIAEGTNVRIPEGWVDASTLRIPGHTGTFTNLMVPEPIAKDLTQASRIFLDAGEADKFLEGFDWFMNQWKSGVTVWFPAFHVRNALSNFFNASYLGGADPRVFAEVIKLQSRIHRGLANDNALIKGTQITLKQFRDIMESNNLGGFGQVTQALQGEAGSRSLDNAIQEAVGGGNAIYRTLRTGGSLIEENAKAGLLLDRLRKGDTVENAVDHVKKYLFDYSDLTGFESGVLKRGFPFYTWLRKNMPLQIGEMLKTPGKYTNIGRALDAANNAFGEDLSLEEQMMLPDFVLGGLGIKRINIGKDPSGGIRTILALGLPFEDLDRLSEPGREILAALAPPFKYVLEEIAGKDFFRNKPLEENNKIGQTSAELIELFGSDKMKEVLQFKSKTNSRGETTHYINPKVVHIMAQLPISRGGSLLKKLEQLADGEAEVIDTALSLIAGLNIYDAELTDYFNNQERIEQLNKIIEDNYPQIRKFERYYIDKKTKATTNPATGFTTFEDK